MAEIAEETAVGLAAEQRATARRRGKEPELKDSRGVPVKELGWYDDCYGGFLWRRGDEETPELELEPSIGGAHEYGSSWPDSD